LAEGAEFWAEWDRVGAEQAKLIKMALPTDWSFEGRRALDFGCGSGRTLRHFGSESDVCEMWGCDIHVESIEWLQSHLIPPFHFFVVGTEPQIPQPDDYFDFVWAMSVFTHITDEWSGWLLELRRVLKPGGLALVSFLGEGMITSLIGEQWDPDRIGMNTLRVAQSWDDGGPLVFHSEWWLRAHWGRAFDIVWLHDHPQGHGLALLSKRDVTLTRADLEILEPNEPREVSALRHNIAQLHREETGMRRELELAQRSFEDRAYPSRSGPRTD
jgi:SAM-dependent methyltransferase